MNWLSNSPREPVRITQYAHARIASLRRVAASRGVACPLPTQAELDCLGDPDELAIIRKLSAYPMVVEASAMGLEPHRIAYYLRELAGMVHPFYNKHRILPPPAKGMPTMPPAQLAKGASRRHPIQA
ncbi:MAG: DALR anticodon-binding domain-containing protein [Nitrospiraceae bacterium]